MSIWFITKLKQIHQEKHKTAYRGGNKIFYKQAEYILKKEIRAAKSLYSKKLEKVFSPNDLTSEWNGLKAIINYKPPALTSAQNRQLAEDFNWYGQFESVFYISEVKKSAHDHVVVRYFLFFIFHKTHH